MKLLLVNSFLHPRGGDTTLFFDEWAGWASRGVEVIPFAMRHPENVVSPWSVRFPSWRSPRSPGTLGARARALAHAIWNREAAGALNDLCRDHRPDAAHVHHVHRHLTPAIFAVLRRHGIRTAWTLHDHELVCPNGLRFVGGEACFRCVGGRYGAAITHRCKDGDLIASAGVALEKSVHRALRGQLSPDAWVSPSRYLAEGLIQDGFPRDRIHHVPNFVEVVAVPGELGTNVVFAGRLAEEKGIAEVATLAAALPGRRIDVYGDGAARHLLAAARNVTLHGALPRENVHAALAQAGVVIVPSRWPENQPYAVLEAQLLARPVVASAVGGVPELIDDDVDGRLVPPGNAPALIDAVRRVFDGGGAAAAMGQRARARVQREHAPERWFQSMGALLGLDGAR